MENDVKEDLEQAKQKQELEKQKQELEKLTQEKEQEIIKEKREYIYIFLGIIIFLFILYFTLSIFTYNEPSQAIKTAHTKTILEILPNPISDLIKNNLDSHQQEISDLLSSSKDKMYSKVDAQIDNLFDPIENNVDKFLDWHYSLKGNYSELAFLTAKFVAKKLGLSVEDALFNKLQEKFLGADYKQRLQTMTDNISDAFISLLRQHKKDTEKIATQGVADISQVVESLKNINDKIEIDLQLKMGFAAAIGATAGVGAGALMEKLAPKLVEKLGTKLGAKFLAKFGIAVGGVLSTLGADVAFNYIDEWLHRDDFKKEILNNINEVKKNLKESYKMGFDNSITKFSQGLQEGLKNIETISVKAHIEKLK
ncbi:hypothetical protein [Helicobacter pylori]|uniref:hypothetical protein n=1 Tax=Helicobacter pylori TaxID=210 RepID=UPI000370D1D6|nr:hypothetical protein [Helicobacter pylori]EQL54540.1 hypothetical protein N404_01205 [Helicobacter pylori FD506]